MTTIAPEGWYVNEDYHGPFTRSFIAEPRTKIVSEMETVELYKGKVVKATYDTRVLNVRLRWDWDDKKKFWWGQASISRGSLNPQTGELYSISNSKSTPIQTHHSFSEEDLPDYIHDLIEVTNPRTIVTVTEAPA